HLFESGFYDLDVRDVAANAVGDEDISQRGVFPAGSPDGSMLFAGGDDPGILGIDFVGGADGATADQLIHVLVREVALAFAIGFLPEFQHVALDADRKSTRLN